MRGLLIRSSFQHSSTPLFHVRGNTQQPQKTLLIPISCRNSDIFKLPLSVQVEKGEETC
jgi:hypothetical protein